MTDIHIVGPTILFVAALAGVYFAVVLPRQLARKHVRELGHHGDGETGWHRWFAWRPVAAGNPDEAWYGFVWLSPVERNIRYFWAIDGVWCREVTYRRYADISVEAEPK